MSLIKDRLPPTLVTTRLVLTAPVMAHAAAIATWCNNKNLHQWMSRLPFPYTEDDARFFIEEIVPSAEEAPYALLLDTALIGVVGLSFAPDQWPELGYWLGEPYWGQGYASEAAAALVAAAREAGAIGLRARALPANAASRNVLTKLGFVETGTTIDAHGNLRGRELVLMQLDFSR